ncbi:MAG: hypothetical protein H6613_01775 [Ignavibacteriales bacterium]|nr:hypothetical protein [Ignavibacteriales bacterium]
MKSFLKLSVLLLITSLLFYSCGEDSPTNPEEKEVPVLGSKSIGSEGGTISIDNFELQVPTGAFQNNSEIKISKSIEANLFSTNNVSDFFVIDGIPAEFDEPIKIKIKYSGILKDSSFIAIGENCFVSSLNNEAKSFRLLSARDSAGYLIAQIPPTVGNGLEKSNSNYSIEADDLSFNLGAIAGYASYKSRGNHFLINFPSSVLTQAYDLADYLETAYNQFQSIGFSYSRRTKWPVEVTVKVLENSVYGYSYNSTWGDNYGYMEFNVNKMGDAEELKVTAGHEFFHLVQSLYDPRNRFSKSKFQSPHLWLDEASSVWSEAFFSGSGSSYVSPIFASNAYEILNGAKTAGSDAQSYGYGSASLIKYLTKNYDNSSLVDVYEKIYNGESAFSALGDVLPISVDMSWHPYLRSLFSFELYKGDSFQPSSLMATAKIKSQNFTIKTAADSVKSFKSSLPDLSATIFSIKNEFEKLNNNAKLEFTCKDWNFQLFKVNGSESKFLASGRDTLVLSNFKKIADEGYQIAVVLYNNDFDSPYNNTKSYEMEIKVKAAKTIQFIYFALAYTGNFTWTTPEETTYSTYETGMSGVVWDRNHQISSNRILVSQDSTSEYAQIKTTIGLTLDDYENPTKILDYSFDRVDKSLHYNDTETFSTAGSGASFTAYDWGSSGIRFEYTGDISQYISKIVDYDKMISNVNDDYYINELTGYESQGTIMIIINYE